MQNQSDASFWDMVQMVRWVTKLGYNISTWQSEVVMHSMKQSYSNATVPQQNQQKELTIDSKITSQPDEQIENKIKLIVFSEDGQQKREILDSHALQMKKCLLSYNKKIFHFILEPILDNIDHRVGR